MNKGVHKMGASEVQESNFNVIVRVRPLSTHSTHVEQPKDKVKSSSAFERQQRTQGAFAADANRTISVLDESIILFDAGKGDAKKPLYSTRRKKEAKYAFDRVFGESATQTQVYEHSGLPLLDTVLQGYNATLFAYGATGCGKTHTIVGTPNDPGIIYLAMRDLFAKLETLSHEKIFDVSLSYLEVYNETIRDLLSTDNQGLELREDDSHIVVSGLSEHSPTSADQVLKMLVDGNEHRTKASTEMNAVSSRSHAVLQVRVRQRDKLTGVSASWTNAVLSIIDLAGSERASATKNRGERLVEGANINRSLLALGNCINALCSESRSKNHIPYRDSKLTRLLKYSLSGNCKVVMIANVSPTVLQAEETHNTLKYANRAKNIRIRAEKNVVDIAYQISQYPLIIEALKSEIQELKKQSEDSVTFSENDIVDELYHDTLDKIRKCYDKIKGKHLERVDIQAKLDWNEFSLQHLEQVKEDVEAAKHADQLDAMNTTLRHNLEEAKIAVERYETQLQDRMDKSFNSLKAVLMHRLTIEKRLAGLLIQIQVMEHQLQLATQLCQTFSTLTCELVRLFVSSSKSDEEKSMALLSVLLRSQKSCLSGSQMAVVYDSCTDASDAESSVGHSGAERDDEGPTGDAVVLAKALSLSTDVSVTATPVRSRLLRDTHPPSGLLSTLKKPAHRKTPAKRKGQMVMSQENRFPQDMDKTPVPVSRKPAAASSSVRQALDVTSRESPRSIKRLKKRRDSMIPTMPQRDGSLLSMARMVIPSTASLSSFNVFGPKTFLNPTTDDPPIRRSQRHNPSRRMSMLPVPK